MGSEMCIRDSGVRCLGPWIWMIGKVGEHCTCKYGIWTMIWVWLSGMISSFAHGSRYLVVILLKAQHVSPLRPSRRPRITSTGALLSTSTISQVNAHRLPTPAPQLFSASQSSPSCGTAPSRFSSMLSRSSRIRSSRGALLRQSSPVRFGTCSAVLAHRFDADAWCYGRSLGGTTRG